MLTDKTAELLKEARDHLHNARAKILAARDLSAVTHHPSWGHLLTSIGDAHARVDNLPEPDLQGSG